jgi:hypothetical protein
MPMLIANIFEGLMNSAICLRAIFLTLSSNLDRLADFAMWGSRAVFLSIAVSWIKKYIVKLDRQYRQPFYIRSDLSHKASRGFNSWFPLDDDLEYSLEISTPDDETPTQILIKNIGESSIEEVSIMIVAEKCFDGFFENYLCNRQENIRLFNLHPGDSLKQYLNNIPRDDIGRI